MSDLTLEVRDQADETPVIGGGLGMMTPPIDEDYWAYRVKLTDEQAVVGFPKFGTIGIGFAKEEDWNTNLPYTSPADEIVDHIWHNAGDESITRERVVEAVSLIRAKAREDRDS